MLLWIFVFLTMGALFFLSEMVSKVKQPKAWASSDGGGGGYDSYWLLLLVATPTKGIYKEKSGKKERENKRNRGGPYHYNRAFLKFSIILYSFHSSFRVHKPHFGFTSQRNFTTETNQKNCFHWGGFSNEEPFQLQ